MREEYDFSQGVRGKHYRAYRAGHVVRVRKSDGSIEQLIAGRKVGNKLGVEGEEFRGHQDNPIQPAGNGPREDAE